jgi:hypothetical protein
MPQSNTNSTNFNQQSPIPTLTTTDMAPQGQPSSGVIQQSPQQRHSDPLGGLNKDKMLNFGDLAKATPPFKDFFNNLHTYQYLQHLEQQSDNMQPRHTQITQQYSSSTDEGCETDDHGGKHRVIC